MSGSYALEIWEREREMKAGKKMTDAKLRAWCNGYEVVAAHSAEEAAQVLLAGCEGGPQYSAEDVEEVEGDGWTMLPDDKFIVDEDHKPTKETVGDAVRTKGVPGFLWSVEQ